MKNTIRVLFLKECDIYLHSKYLNVVKNKANYFIYYDPYNSKLWPKGYIIL